MTTTEKENTVPFPIIRKDNPDVGPALARADCPKGEKSSEWPDKAQADARCEKANADAAELGIRTRYEVIAA